MSETKTVFNAEDIESIDTSCKQDSFYTEESVCNVCGKTMTVTCYLNATTNTLGKSGECSCGNTLDQAGVVSEIYYWPQAYEQYNIWADIDLDHDVRQEALDKATKFVDMACIKDRDRNKRRVKNGY